MARPPNHEGTPKKLPSGRYRIQISLDGRRHSVTGDTPTEARKARNELLKRQKEQRLSRERRDRWTVGAYLDWWLAAKKGTVEPSTYTRYVVEVKMRLKPTIGALRLGQLASGDLDGARRRMLAGEPPFTRSYAPRTVQYALETIHLALKRAAADGDVGRNVAEDVAGPKVVRGKAKPFGAAEVEQLLAQSSGDWRTMWLLALYSGLRMGELLGLPKSAIVVDAASGEASVTVAQVLAEDGEGGWYIRGYPKSAAGFRTVRVPAFVAAELRAHLERQAAEKAAASRWERDDLVFVSRYGTVLLRSNVERLFKQHCDAAKITGKTNVHRCRHTFASHLFAEGRPVTEISYLLGHASRTVTLDVYGHMIPETPGSGAPSALVRSYRGAGDIGAASSAGPREAAAPPGAEPRGGRALRSAPTSAA